MRHVGCTRTLRVHSDLWFSPIPDKRKVGGSTPPLTTTLGRSDMCVVTFAGSVWLRQAATMCTGTPARSNVVACDRAPIV